MERGNLFTLSLGNVQPDDVIVIRFAYVEELDAWKDEMALQIPFTPGVRYIPGEPLLRSNSGKGAVDDTDQVADASRISPPRIDQMHPDAARLSLSGKLDGRDVDLCSISSPTHPTAVRPVGDDFEIFLPSNVAVPDRDFVLRWRRAARPLDELPLSIDPASLDFEMEVPKFRMPVGGIVQPKEIKRLTEQLCRIVDSAFCPTDAKKLVRVMQDWAKHADGKLVRDVLCALLRECESNGDIGRIRKVLSDFFFALPDPWHTVAAAVLAGQSLNQRYPSFANRASGSAARPDVRERTAEGSRALYPCARQT